MFADGLRDEVAALLARGFGEHVKPLQSLGYAQTIRHLKGELSLEAAIAATQSETRHYAKRQLTWFRREKDVVWFNGFGSQLEIHSAVVERVRSFLRHFGSSGELLLEPAESSRPQPDSDGDC
jgi:tRNA dimethylallyltransferase